MKNAFAKLYLALLGFGIAADPTHLVQVYAPTLIRIPAGTISGNEYSELVRNFVPSDPGAAPGDVAPLPAQRVGIISRTNTNFDLAYLLHNNATNGQKYVFADLGSAGASGTVCIQNVNCGSGLTAAGKAGDMQIKSSAGGFRASGSSTDYGSAAIAKEDMEFCKGTNPYVDARCYLVGRANWTSPPMVPGITGTIAAGSNQLTINTASCGSMGSCFSNNEGIAVYGAGSANKISTPPAPSVYAATPYAPTNTGLTVPSQAGSTTWQYCVAAWDDALGDVTACSPATVITNGQTTLGPQSVSVTSMTLSNNTVSFVTAAPQYMGVGAMFDVYNAGDSSYNQHYIVNAWTDTTHFSAVVSGKDSRRGDNPNGGTATLTYWLCNHITAVVATGSSDSATKYLIYGRAAGSMTLIGVMKPQWSELVGQDNAYLSWDDFGPTMSAIPTLPYYIPTTAPSVATNGILVTKVAGGGGTTVLTLANNAVTSVTNAPTLHSDNVGLKAGLTQALNAHARFRIVGGWYAINAPLALGTNVNSMQMEMDTDYLVMNDTMTITSGKMNLSGLVSQNQQTSQFDFMPHVAINSNRAYPCIYSTGPTGPVYGSTGGGDIDLHNIAFNDNNPQGLTMLVDGGSNEDYDRVSFTQTGQSTISWMSRGRHDGNFAAFSSFWDEVNIAAGQYNYGSDMTPALFFSQGGGNPTFNSIHLSGKGIFISTPQQGILATINWIYSQGNYEPFVTMGNFGGGAIWGQIKISRFTNDTTYVPEVSVIGTANSGLQVLATLEDGLGSPVGPQVTASGGYYTGATTVINGWGWSTAGGSEVTPIPQNALVGGYGYIQYPIKYLKSALQLAQSYPLFTNMITGYVPTVTCTATPNASAHAQPGTQSFGITPVFRSYSEGATGWCSVTVPAEGYQVNMSWTPILGVIGYNVYWGGALGNPNVNYTNCGNPQIPASATPSAIYIVSFGCGVTKPNTNAGGPAGIQDDMVWASKLFGATLNTAGNCSSSTGSCFGASAGSVAIAAATTTVTVSTNLVTANSQILVTEDSSLGTKLGVTCNTTLGRSYVVTARTAGTSFVITASAAPTTNPACLSYSIVN